MKKIIWKLRYTYYMCRVFDDFWPSGIRFGWYNASVWADECDIDEHPKDAVLEEVSRWDPE